VRSVWILTAGACCALALWPAAVRTASQREASATLASLATPAPVTADYRERDRLVAFWEGAARQHETDQVSPRILAEQYLQRYRERGDADDAVRAEATARRSLSIQPRGNIGADLALSSALLTQHRFTEALAPIRDAQRYEPWNGGPIAREASLEIELGHYERARALLARIRPGPVADPAVDTVRARLYEVTGHLAQARPLLERAMRALDTHFDAPAQARAWYHMRAAELAFAAGENEAALAESTQALADFPSFAQAFAVRARIEAALHRWPQARADAARSAELVPSPEALGYLADAQRALGESEAARKTDGLIEAVARIGNARRLFDRLISLYDSDHHVRRDEALRIARRDLAVRDDIYAEDALAWALAANGRFREAAGHMRAALRFDTEDARLQYHAAAIAFQLGDRAEARRRASCALALNPHFHPAQADDARAILVRTALRLNERVLRPGARVCARS
jgi:tetratricopeptide (TPR) repeat protein